MLQCVHWTKGATYITLEINLVWSRILDIARAPSVVKPTHFDQSTSFSFIKPLTDSKISPPVVFVDKNRQNRISSSIMPFYSKRTKANKLAWSATSVLSSSCSKIYSLCFKTVITAIFTFYNISKILLFTVVFDNGISFIFFVHFSSNKALLIIFSEGIISSSPTVWAEPFLRD